MATIQQIDKRKDIPKQLNVAAYARVSCDKCSMLQSLVTQVSYFSSLIQSNKNWNYAGVYSDYGISGTKASRGDFDKLLEEAKQGKIDLILVKGLSRFARNTEVTLTWIRALKAINVAIYFEEEGINTLTSEGELLISLLAASAQEQSRNASKNVLWRVKRNFEQGITYGGSDCYGYKLVKHEFVIVHDQAAVVKRMFELYVEGNGDMKISKILNSEGIKPMIGKLWERSTVRGILTNYNYTGDLLLQKTYRLDYLSKKTQINRGEKDMYLVENHHEPIVSKELFEKAKAIRLAKGGKKSPTSKASHPFSKLIICGCCGKRYKFKKTRYIPKYECTTFNNHGKAYCNQKSVPEEKLILSIKNLLQMENFDEAIMRSKISKIVVLDNNGLEVHLKDGTIEHTTWQDRSRRESWTPEMREKVRQRNLLRKEVRING